MTCQVIVVSPLRYRFIACGRPWVGWLMGRRCCEDHVGGALLSLAIKTWRVRR